MINTVRSIGLFGGSFDPPHLGHVALVQAGLEMGLDEVWVMPALPVHRELSGKADGAMRFNWLQQVFEDEPRVRLLDWEISQSSPTATVDSLRRFKAEYSDTVPWLMLGDDAWQGLTSWREYPKHQRLCNIAVFARQCSELSQPVAHAGWQQVGLDCWSVSRTINPTICQTAGHYCHVPVALPEISATLVRQRAALGLPLTNLVPKVLQSEIEKYYQ